MALLVLNPRITIQIKNKAIIGVELTVRRFEFLCTGMVCVVYWKLMKSECFAEGIRFGTSSPSSHPLTLKTFCNGRMSTSKSLRIFFVVDH